MKKYLPFILIAGVLLAAVVAVWLWTGRPSRELPRPEINPSAAPAARQKSSPQSAPERVTAHPPTHVRGPANAPVLLEEYSDFQCPTCGQLHTVIKQLLAKYPTQVAVAFRHFPLQSIHRHAREAARASEAAGMQGKFWEMHDLLYERQGEWSKADSARPLFVEYARLLGLDTTRFANDIDSSTAAMRVVADERLARSLNLSGTPTFYINGHPLAFEESNTLERLSAAVERALRRGN